MRVDSTLHGVGLSAPSLTIRKYGAVESFDRAEHYGRNALIENMTLCCVVVIDSLEAKALGLCRSCARCEFSLAISLW